MLAWFKHLDRILRGEATRLSDLREGKIEIDVKGLIAAVILLSVFYGLCTGSYSVIQTGGKQYMQIAASAVKFPMLFILTLIVTFPSLYVFNTLVGSKLSIVSVFRLLIAAKGVILAVLASLGPIVVFFSISTTSYPFMILLNVVAGTVSGVLGLAFLMQTLHRLVSVRDDESNTDESPETRADKNAYSMSALEKTGIDANRKATFVFRIWVVVFALVGAQMSWVLRPFIGNPESAFTWFRARESNFFESVLKSFVSLFS